MTFTPTPVGAFHVLVTIELTGKALYYADVNMSMSDGNFYEGRLSVSSLQRAFSSFTEPKQRQSTLTITLKDADLTIRQLLDDYTWGNRHVKVYIGKGRDINDYSIDFHGIIKFPGGIEFDRKEVRIKLRDARNKDVVMLPINKYWESNYPNLEDGAEGNPIPIVYGDFSDMEVPATCINTSINEFKIADHSIYDIVQVYKNGGAVSHSNEDLENATFRISSYDPDNDTVTVKLIGKIEGYVGGPTGIIEDILENYLEVSADNIDYTSFTELDAETGDMKCRRYIGDELSSNTLLEELAIECLFDIFIDNDKYTVRSRRPTTLIDSTFDTMTIAPNSLNVEGDPENLYNNRIKCNYVYDPVEEKFWSVHEANQTTEQERVQQTITRNIDFNWLYEYDDVFAVAEHLILLYSHEINVIKFTAYGEGILIKLADRVGLTFAHYEDRPLLVREITKNFNNMSCTIYGYDSIQHVLPGYWADDDAPNYDNATEEQRKSFGFWTNDDGEAKTGDEDSKVSHWW